MNFIRTNTILQTLLWFLAFSLILAWIGADNLYTGDSLVKLFQAKSLLANNFTSEKLIYPANEFDPNYEFYFFGSGMTLPFNGYLIGQYPLLFSAILSVAVSIIPDKLLAYISLFFSALVFYFFSTQFKIDNKQKIILACCTPIFYMSFDLSEHAFLLLMQIPFLVSYFSESKSSKFLPSLLFGLSSWLRLEVVIFSFCFFFFLFIIYYRLNIIEFFKKEILSISGFAIGILIIGVTFIFLYGHPLGTRYLLNSSGYVNSFSQKLNIFIGLLFAGNMKFGFYLVSMYFFAISIYCMFHFNSLNQQEKLLFLSSFVFTILVGLISPFDAVRGWGSRFLFLSILPFSILFISISKKIEIDKKLWKNILRISIGWSGFATLLGILLVFATAKHMEKLRNQLNDLKGDLIVFSDEYTTPYFSLNFFTHKAVLISNPEKYDKFKLKVVTSKNILSFIYIFPKVSDELKVSLAGQSNEFSLSQNVHDSIKKDFAIYEVIEKKDFLIYRYSNQYQLIKGSK
jgi:hypothetical protein